jgi:serine/threonine protein kinase
MWGRGCNLRPFTGRGLAANLGQMGEGAPAAALGSIAPASVHDPDPFDLTGDLLDGQFRVLSVAGEGDLTIVYRGRHEGIDAPVAIKCLNLPQTLDARFVAPLVESFREGAKLHYKLAQGHLHVAQSLACGTTVAPRSGTVIPYMVREWLEGRSLAQDFEARTRQGVGARTIREAMALLGTAADALAFAHAQGIVHHWVNPQNLFVVRTPQGEVTKVLDFGVAKVMNVHSVATAAPQAPVAGLRVLLPMYAAPEQLDRDFGVAGPATDVYAFALIFYETLAGRPVVPRDAVVSELVRAMRVEERPRARALGIVLPSEVEAVLSRALSLAPGDRQRTMGELWSDLSDAVARSGEAKQTDAAEQRPARPPPKKPSVRRKPPPLPTPRPAAESTTGQAAPPVVVEPEPVSFEMAMEALSPVPTPAPLPVPLSASEGAPIVGSIFETIPEHELAEMRAVLPPWRMPWRALGIAACIGTLIGIGAAAGARSRPTRAMTRLSAPIRAEARAAPKAIVAGAVARGTTIVPAAALPAVKQRFDRDEARAAFDAIDTDLPSCAGKGLPRGIGSVRVRIEPSGKVTKVQIGPPYAGTRVGRCIVDRFAAAALPPHEGPPQAMNYVFRSIPW